MITWTYILVAAIGLLVFLLYQEWKRKNKKWLAGRLLVSVLAVFSLLMMAYPYAQQNDQHQPKKLVLLTAGFIKDSAEIFLNQTKEKIPVYTDANLQSNAGVLNTAQLVTNWTSFAEQHAGDTIHVFGNGLDKEALASISPHPVVFHASPALPGISHIYWKQHLQAGAPLVIQGHCENPSAKKLKIILQAFNANKDSVFTDAFTSNDFSLRIVPLHAATAVYSLLVLAGKDTLEKEPVPVSVQGAPALQLLIISSSPDFENTFLKNHLSQQGYQVTINNIISTNKTNKQFLNMPAQQADKLTTAYLNKFDVLIADEAALQKTGAAETAAIRAAIQDNGTGLLIKMDSTKNNTAFYTRFFPVKTTQPGKQFQLLLQDAITDSNRYKIKTADPATIAFTPGTQALLQDQQSGIYAAAVVYGKGKIIATTLQNTYSIALAGDKTSYRQLWWLLLNKAAKKIYPGDAWQTNPFFPHINEPVELLEEANAAEANAVLNEALIYLRQDALLPFQWQGTYWPTVTGWCRAPGTGVKPGSWFVCKTSDWESLARYEHATETKKYAAIHPVLFEPRADWQTSLFSINALLLMLFVFLICCTFLWMEQKAG